MGGTHGDACDGYKHGASLSDVYSDPEWWNILIWTVGGTCVLVSCIIFAIHATLHIKYAERKYRKTYVLVLSIVPVFALSAGFTIFLIRGAELMLFLRHIWEAVVLYAFWGVVRHFCGSWEKAEDMCKDYKVYKPFSFCCCQTMHLTKERLEYFGYGVLQFAVVNIVLEFMSSYASVYCLTSPTGENSFLVLQILRFLSLLVAMYCLLAVSNVMAKVLPEHRIKTKFWAIKLAIVITFVQMFILQRLAKKGVIDDTGPYDRTELMFLIYNFLLAVEMVPLALLLVYAYPVADHDRTKRVRTKSEMGDVGV